MIKDLVDNLEKSVKVVGGMEVLPVSVLDTCTGKYQEILRSNLRGDGSFIEAVAIDEIRDYYIYRVRPKEMRECSKLIEKINA